MPSTYYTSHLGVLRETEKAILVKFESEEIWIPKSQVIDWNDSEIEMSTWIAQEKGLVP